MKSFSIKELKYLILYTIVLIFAFIYIKDIINRSMPEKTRFPYKTNIGKIKI